MPAKKTSKKNFAASVMDDIIDSCDSRVASNAAKPAVFQTPPLEDRPDPVQFDFESGGAGDLLSGSFLPPSREELDMADKIARLEKSLAEATAGNADLVDRLAKYVSESSDVDSRVAAAQKEASEAKATAKQLRSEKASLEKALAAAEAKIEEFQMLLQAKTAFDQLKADDAAPVPTTAPARRRPFAAAFPRYGTNGYEGWN